MQNDVEVLYLGIRERQPVNRRQCLRQLASARNEGRFSDANPERGRQAERTRVHVHIHKDGGRAFDD